MDVPRSSPARRVRDRADREALRRRLVPGEDLRCLGPRAAPRAILRAGRVRNQPKVVADDGRDPRPHQEAARGVACPTRGRLVSICPTASRPGSPSSFLKRSGRPIRFGRMAPSRPLRLVSHYCASWLLPRRSTSTPSSTPRKPPWRRAVARRRSAARSATEPSSTAGATPRVATVRAAATSRSLPPLPPARMIPVPMPRTSPDSGGRYETPEMLVEVHRRTRDQGTVVRRPPGRPALSVGLREGKGGAEVAGAPRQRAGDPASLRAAPLPARERAGVGPGDADSWHDVAAVFGEPSAPE